MTTPQELKATERDTTLTPRQLRAAGYVPATVYGTGDESKLIQVKAHEFIQYYHQGARQFKLTGFVNGVASIKQVQTEAVSRAPLSIEFYQGDGQGKSAKSGKKPALSGV